MRRLLFILPVLLFAGLAVAFAVGLGLNPREVPSNRIDKPVPTFELAALPGLDAPGLASTDLGGEVTLVNVFASWCVPCLAEHPLLVGLARAHALRIVGINYKDKPEDALAWLRRHGNPYARIGADREGRTGIDFGISGVPETFIVDKSGRIAYQHIGPLTAEVIEDEVLPLVEELRQ